MGRGFLYYHQINMPIRDSEKLISQIRVRVSGSCSRKTHHISPAGSSAQSLTSLRWSPCACSICSLPRLLSSADHLAACQHITTQLHHSPHLH